MPESLTKRVAALTGEQALEAGEALATLLEAELPGDDVDTADFDALVADNDAVVGKLYEALRGDGAPDEQAADGARTMLLLVADLGFEAQVELAIEAAAVHQRDFGALSGPLILAGLAAVIAYIPKEQRSKVTTMRHVDPDGSVVETQVSESETIRVGAEAVEKLASWWKALLAGGA